MNTLQAGFSRVTITPPLSIAVPGYYIPRFAKGVLDELEANLLALSDGLRRILIISVDTLGIEQPVGKAFRDTIAAATGLNAEDIFLSATHTHTGGALTPQKEFAADLELISSYREYLGTQLARGAAAALADLQPVRLGYGTVSAPDRIAFIRRYRMKDGSTQTCPDFSSGEVDRPIGDLDRQVHILRFQRKDNHDIVILNYGLHADTINGELLSADWPGWMRRTFEAAVPGSRCFTLIGAEGDVGSTNPQPSAGDMNDTEISFDNEMKSYGMCRFVGRALAGAALQIYDKVEFIEVDHIDLIHFDLMVKANTPLPEELPLAHYYRELHDQGRDDLIPYRAMELTTVVAEAIRMCMLENGPSHFHLDMSAVSLGDLALVGIPGEPFTGLGMDIKAIPGWKLILPCAVTGGYEGYFPTKEAFDEGGYEARCSSYTKDVAGALIDAAAVLLQQLRLSEQKQ